MDPITRPAVQFESAKASLILLSSFLVIGLFSSVAKAEDVVITVTGDPVQTGSGSNLKARYSNVATVDGKSVDLVGEVLSQATNKTNNFWQGGEWALPGDFVFSFNNMVIGETREATVRWSFYESGTTTPVVFEEFTITLDDLDNHPSGGNGRTETVSTTDADSYTIDSSTNLAVSNLEETISVTGGSNQNPGDSDGAIRYRFSNLSTFTMTYRTVPRGATNSAFHHDGHGAFTFDDPVDTDLGERLYYTYNLNNNGDSAVPVQFTNNLPAGLAWDDGYIYVTGNLTGGTPVFSNGNVSINNLILHPGSNSLTLRTLKTFATGTIVNEATVDPGHPQLDPMTRSASITLP